MNATDIRDLINHINHFGASAVVRKSGGKWWVRFREFGPPTPFKTKRDAMAWAANWPGALRQSQQIEVSSRRVGLLHVGEAVGAIMERLAPSQTRENS